MAPPVPKIPAYLAGLRQMNNGTEKSAGDKQRFHQGGELWLSKLAGTLRQGDYNLRLDRGGPATSGAVTLEGSGFRVRLAEESGGHGGITVSYTAFTGLGGLAVGQSRMIPLALLAAVPSCASMLTKSLHQWATGHGQPAALSLEDSTPDNGEDLKRSSRP